MDPVTAFSLAAGILQVVDISFKAVSRCREIYEDGSLAHHRDTAEITRSLAETTNGLEKSISGAPPAGSKENKDVIEISKKCSETSKELLDELEKLQIDPKESWLQAIKHLVRAELRKKFLKETQKKLEKYQSILDTSILSKLDAHAIEQVEQFKILDQSIKNLAIGLSEGRNTFAQLHAENVAFREHFDRRTEDQAIQRAQQQFKDSLFFPEIFARQEEIHNSHKGTCSWIFDTPKKEQPWASFTEWLKDSDDVYWLSGKPGSGKSTLMKYISSELRSFCLGDGALPCWNTAEADLVVCSFFFWNIGSPLQKNYVGFLRAILYQICEQREDLIPAIMGQAATLEARNIKASESIQLCTWTEERLNTALIRFLASKPSSLRICLLIDGLDEFLGDEDSLMEMIRRLSRTPHTHVCVSSRPEQIFRQGFAKSPQLKLQDLNYKDIQKATNDQLKPTLEKWFPALTFEISGLVEDVIDKSQGVFLWAELMIKDLRRGACNADTIQELQERLNRTPDTIEGLYEHMLKRLDKIYAQDAARYFRLLMADQEILNGKFPLTLLHFACAEDRAWEHVLKRDQEHFQSSYFYNLCGNLETRILTRCVGFVEIEEHRPKLLKGAEILECLDNRKHLRSPRVYVSEEEGNISHYLREVRFIHRTVVEFLQNYKEFFQDPHGPQSACFALTRSRIGVLSLTPFVVPDGNVNQGAIRFNIRYLSHIINGLLATEASWSAQEATCDQAIHIINEMYNVITYVNMTVNEPMYVLSKCYEQDGWIFRMPSIKRLDLPFDDCVGFASFFGCHRYVSRYITQSHPGRPNFERIVSSVLMGMICLDSRRINLICSYNNIQRFKILLDSVPHSRDPCFEVAGSDSTAPVFRKFRSLVVFIYLSGDFIAEILARTDKFNARTLWMDVFAAFFNQTPDPNMILRFEYYGGQFVVGNRTLWIRYIMDESLLTYSMRKVASTEPNLSNEIGDLLRSRGGLEYRSFHSIGIEWFGQAGYLYRRLTLEQSERLRHTYTQAFSFQESGVDYLFDGDVCIPDEEPWPTTPDAEAEKAVNLLIEHMACENCDRHRVIDEDSVPDVNPDTDEDSISDAEAMELTDIFI